MLRIVSSIVTTLILAYLFSFAARFIGREKQQAEQNRVRLSILFYRLGQIFAAFFATGLLCIYLFVKLDLTVFIASTFGFGTLVAVGLMFMAMYRNWYIEYDESGIRYRSHFGRKLAFAYTEIKKFRHTQTGIVLHVKRAKIIVDFRTIGFEKFMDQLRRKQDEIPAF